ncbi:uncharacterized protein Z519_03026 [Cladophialophora bantiana CBS 173.52]|uniref:Transcription factor BYE1 n=1 Tax=Cladophialophora bantiana (strain ATCC 10958 / CBS 173.52 / CDC B-1940 / NIH 8579) TaxID=1442370 RepID=A0A0D2HYG3_CLAB1|nr:uncharacterized protein Z519_03026 [Cladophialophora bantiana CBS 173.52]KIW95960.1 hypothetical protein Z519_03026 [Cladophialophora bantiana CBS 173.52]
MAGKHCRYLSRTRCVPHLLRFTDAVTEEPRRSGRATKGQYSKDRDIAEGVPTKKKDKGKATKAKAAEQDESEEIIRCVCGTYEEEEDVPRAMICCDNCSAWQHNSCMGLPEDYEPPQYFCEQCRPEDHQELVAAIARGEKPWEEAARQKEAAEAGKGKKKGGRKGRKSGAARTSEVVSRTSQDVDETPAHTPAAGQKRKLEESPSVPEVKNKKARGTPAADTNGTKAVKVETPSRQASRSEPVSAVAVDVKELTNKSRSQAASTLIKLIEQQIKEAVKQGDYTVPPGTSATEVANQIGLRTEHALYHVQVGGNGDPNESYKNQLRAITFNVKKNRALGVRLLNGDLLPHTLASMDAKDMASEEQKKKDAAVMKELEKQHTIVEEQGPRIRRTHKGEEYVDESRQVAAESATSNAPVRKASVAEQDGDAKSPGVRSPCEAPAAPGKGIKPRPSVDTTRRQSSANFDIDKVWSNVQGSPDGDGQRFGELPQTTSPTVAVREPIAPGTKADADIDELLKDEEAESPPYSPKESAEADGVVWRGIVNGNNLGRFHAVARYAAGATPEADTLRMTYDQIIPPEIDLGGRIQPSRAEEYLCGLEYSSTSDLVIVCMPQPTNSHDQEQFDRFFQYFKNKNRFGVGIQHTNPAIKDIYLIPLDKGQEMPTFVKKLETDFPDPAQEKMLLVPIVIKNSELSHNTQATLIDGTSATAASPAVGGGPIAQTPITPHEGSFPYSQSPMPNQHGVNGTPQPQQGLGVTPAFTTPTPSSSLPQPHQQPSQQTLQLPPPPNPAMVIAQKVLGPQLASSPSVVQLCEQVPTAAEGEFLVVKKCLEQNPEAQSSLGVLTGMLQDVMAQTRGGDSGGTADA